MCGENDVMANTPLKAQKKGDCIIEACDGAGGITKLADDTDIEDDKLECTVDTCSNGIPQHAPKQEGAKCAQGVCRVDGQCVECLLDSDCMSNVCDMQANTCSPATCNDNIKNGAETDKDCGGGACPGCPIGLKCMLSIDCLSNKCTGGFCAASCTDGLLNNGETDIDCGGPNCPKCAVGQTCTDVGDCILGSCPAGVCDCAGAHVMISEVRSRGVGGGSDEFVELYNPTGADVVLDAAWILEARSSTAGAYAARWTGSGKTIPAHKHYLITGSQYMGAGVSDGILSPGVGDAGGITLKHMGMTVDALCYYYSAQNKTTVTNGTYVCEGMPVSNLPHNDGTGASNSDVSIERLPGGALGGCMDGGDNSVDFATAMPSTPQDTTK